MKQVKKYYKVSYWIDGHKHVCVVTKQEALSFIREFLKLGWIFGCEPI